jgi:hypothetical protein
MHIAASPSLKSQTTLPHLSVRRLGYHSQVVRARAEDTLGSIFQHRPAHCRGARLGGSHEDVDEQAARLFAVSVGSDCLHPPGASSSASPTGRRGVVNADFVGG